MKRRIIFLLLLQMPLLAFAGMIAVTAADVLSDLRSLVEAEKAFCRISEEKGARDAFLAYLADDSVLFHPRAVSGREWWQGQPQSPGKLTWRPVFADISASGDLGYTTGPYEFRASSEDKSVHHGNYFTIWRKEANGQWKVVLDYGTSNPGP